MEPSELDIAYNSAMDDTDPQIVSKAFLIYNDKTLTEQQKIDALWKLLQRN